MTSRRSIRIEPTMCATKQPMTHNTASGNPGPGRAGEEVTNFTGGGGDRTTAGAMSASSRKMFSASGAEDAEACTEEFDKSSAGREDSCGEPGLVMVCESARIGPGPPVPCSAIFSRRVFRLENG